MAPHPQNPDHPAASSRPLPVGELLARVAEQRGLDFEPAPAAVTDALPGLLHIVEGLVARLDDVQERRWLAAALAAVSHHVQAGTLPEGSNGTGSAAAAVAARDRGGVAVAVAVVTSVRGVLAGRRRDGIPRWVFPGGAIEDGETPAQAAVRECAEETGLQVTAEGEIGRRTHPVTGQLITYVGCTAAGNTDAWVGAPEELVEVCWLGRGQVEDLMPDLHNPVRAHLDRHAASQPER